MTGGGDTHETVVATWLEQTERLAADQLVDLLDTGLHGLLLRARPTLGELTVSAICDRVIYTARERYAILAPLSMSEGRVVFDGLRESLGVIAPEELQGAIRFVLVEFLAVIGHLTAEILTPALHAQLIASRPLLAPLNPRTRKTNK